MRADEKKKKSFVMYTDYAAPVGVLSDEDAGKLFKAILQHSSGVTVEEFMLPDSVKPLFVWMREQLDANRLKYEETCAKRAEYGKRGGRPKADNTE